MNYTKDGKLILSTHVPKTGGNSFLTILRGIFGRSLLLDHPSHPERKPEEWIRRIVDHEVKVIHGHFALYDKWHNHLPPFHAVGWVRNPYTRVMSHWEYASYRYTIGKHPLSLEKILKNGDFEEYCRTLHNMQSRYITPENYENYDFIGIVEDYARCLNEFGHRFIGTPSLGMIVENTNHKRGPGAKYEFTKDQKKIIEKYNEKDFELYRKAQELWK